MATRLIIPLITSSLLLLWIALGLLLDWLFTRELSGRALIWDWDAWMREREKKAAEKARKAEERMRKTLGLSGEGRSDPDRYWNSDRPSAASSSVDHVTGPGADG